MVSSLIRSILGPELYRIYKHEGLPGKNYQTNTLEYLGNTFISLVSLKSTIFTPPFQFFHNLPISTSSTASAPFANGPHQSFSPSLCTVTTSPPTPSTHCVT